MEQHDVIVIGAGVNGLGAGAYLSKAGLDVLVLEKTKLLGCGCSTAELTVPGFKHDVMGTYPMWYMLSPLRLYDELNLASKYGVKGMVIDPAMGDVYPDGTCMPYYKDIDKRCQEIAKHSEKDAETIIRKHYLVSSAAVEKIESRTRNVNRAENRKPGAS